jgi:ABC-type antimicrobial peptide transport system permease subunit
MTVVARGAGDPRRLLEEVEARVRAVDERVAVYNAKTAAAHVDAALGAQRAAAAALNAIGLVALLLAAVGLHATLAFLVARRAREIGVRRALGAAGIDVAWLVCRRLVTPVGLGLAAGTGAGLAAGRSLEGLLHGVRAADPLVLGLAPLTVLAAGALAGFAPARRAVRLDPARSLRCE